MLACYSYSIHLSAWRDCLENSWKASRARFLAARGPISRLPRPPVAAFGAAIRDLFRFSKQFRRDCPKSTGSARNVASRAPKLRDSGRIGSGIPTNSTLGALLAPLFG